MKSLDQIASNFEQMGSFVKLGGSDQHKSIGGYQVLDLIVYLLRLTFLG